MKKFFAMIAILCLMVCSQGSNGDIEMYVEEGSVTNSGLTLVMLNHSEEITYGHYLGYCLEKKTLFGWEDADHMSDNVSNGNGMIGINPGGQHTFTYDWSTMIGTLEAGTYRITKTFCPGIKKEDVLEYSDDTFTVSAEFVIK